MGQAKKKHTISPEIHSKDITQWLFEKQWHLTDEYFEVRNYLLQNTKPAEQVCAFCGFPDGRFLEVHHCDNDHENWNEDNLVLACSLCHRLHHWGWIAVEQLGDLQFIKQPDLPDISEYSLKPQTIDNLEYLSLLQRFHLLSSCRSKEENEVFIAASPLTHQQKDNNLSYTSSLDNQYQMNRILDLLEDFEKEKLAAVENKDGADDIRKKIKNVFEQVRERIYPTQRADDLFLRHPIGLADLLDGLCRSEANHVAKNGGVDNAPFKQFNNNQREQQYGLFFIVFNENIFHPFSPQLNYSFEERMAYYKAYGFGQLDRLDKIYHDFA